jgi:hypothetical protein
MDMDFYACICEVTRTNGQNPCFDRQCVFCFIQPETWSHPKACSLCGEFSFLLYVSPGDWNLINLTIVVFVHNSSCNRLRGKFWSVVYRPQISLGVLNISAVLEICRYTNQNFFLFLNFIPAFISIYYVHLGTYFFPFFLTVYPYFAFKKYAYTSTCKCPFRALCLGIPE